MNIPLEINEFTLFLNFKNENSFGLIEITEPIGFDAFSFVVSQDDDRYGRDVEYGGSEIQLEFHDIATQVSIDPITLPNGVIIDRLTMGLQFLLETNKITGFESEVEFIIRRNNIDFIVGNIDFSQAETDGLSYFRCKVVQNTDKALVKRRSEIKVDLFSEVDLDDLPVEPIETHNVLLKAKPIRQVSVWLEKELDNIQNSNSNYLNAMTMIPLANNLKTFGIDNSFAPFDTYVHLSGYPPEALSEANFNNRIITAETTITECKIVAKKINVLGFIDALSTSARIVCRRFIQGASVSIEAVTYDIPLSSGGVFSIENQDYEFYFPIIQAGESVAVFFEVGFSASVLQTYIISISHFNSESLEVELTSTHIDSVIKGVRHIDLMKSTAKRLGDFEVIAPKYDVNGEFYNNFIFNGYLMRQFEDKPLTTSFKEVTDQLQELNADYQVLPNKRIFIGTYIDFYSFQDLGAFLQIPDEDFEVDYNERYLLQAFNYRYKSYEQDKDEENTIDAVHTEAEFMTPNRQIEGTKTIDVPYIRDPFKIESTRRRNFVSTETISTSEDDTFFAIDVVPLPPNSTNILSNVLDIMITNNPNEMKILAKDNFVWNLLGFNVGDSFPVVSFSIDGVTYTYAGSLEVSEIESTLLTLTTTVPFENQVLGNRTIFITIEYPLTNVSFVNRTNEGFDVIENIAEPNNFSNLKYTIRRNMYHWEAYIRTACNYKPFGIFKNTYWKSNGELITKMISEGVPIKENEDKALNNFNARQLLTPVLYRTTVLAEYEDVLMLMNNLNQIHGDNSIGGMIRIYNQDLKVIFGYVKDLEYTIGTKTLELLIEERWISNITTISRNKNMWIINEVGYDVKIVGKELNYKANGDYLQLFDLRGVPLTNTARFDFYSVGGVKNSIIELCKAIDEL